MESWSNEKILELLHTHTPEEVKVLLNKKDPPTFSQLLKLPWTDTSDLDTYAKLVFSGREKDATSKEHWVYVGSATNIAVGLRGRRKTTRNLASKSKYTNPSTVFSVSIYNPNLVRINHYYSEIVHGDVKRNQKFVTLFRVRQSWSSGEEKFKESKAISIIAEGVFAIMLGAYRGVSNPTLHDACVYGNPSQVLKWSGACLRFCLTEQLREIVALKPLATPKPLSNNDRMRQWASQERWFGAYDLRKEPEPETTHAEDEDSDGEGQIQASSSKNADKLDGEEELADEAMIDVGVVDEDQMGDEPTEDENMDVEQMDDDNQSAEEETPVELNKAAAKRKRLAENSRRWRAAHPDHKKAKRAAMTPEELAAKREKDRDDTRRRRAANPGREKARIAAMKPKEREAYKAKRVEDKRRERARKRGENPMPKHVVPDKNKRRNEKRQMQRKAKAGPETRRLAKFQQRVQRARVKLNKLKEENAPGNEIHDALVTLAVAEVDRLEETMAQGKQVHTWVSPSFYELAKAHRKEPSHNLLIHYEIPTTDD